MGHICYAWAGFSMLLASWQYFLLATFCCSPKKVKRTQAQSVLFCFPKARIPRGENRGRLCAAFRSERTRAPRGFLPFTREFLALCCVRVAPSSSFTLLLLSTASMIYWALTVHQTPCQAIHSLNKYLLTLRSAMSCPNNNPGCKNDSNEHINKENTRCAGVTRLEKNQAGKRDEDCWGGGQGCPPWEAVKGDLAKVAAEQDLWGGGTNP